MIYSFQPIADRKSRILVLGTMPSPASLAAGMYYSHPQNKFWRIMGDLFHEFPGNTPSEKTEFLLQHRIALWDTLQCCDREGSLDSNIKNLIPNNIRRMKSSCPELAAVFLNGTAAYRYYVKFHSSEIGLPFFRLPSTSPANCREGYSEKLKAWFIICSFLIGL